MKVVFLDFGVFMHRAIFAGANNERIIPTYLALTMMLACLNRIEIYPDDLIIVAVDSPKGSWRKDIDIAYKANRRKARERSNIDWKKQFSDFDKFRTSLEEGTPFFLIEIDRLEADDIIAFGTRYYSDSECVIVSSDSDFEQLTAHPNVKIFSPITKKYKHVKNPYILIGKKIHKEVADNLVTPILSQIDYDRRNTIVNLTALPKDVEDKIEIEFQNLPEMKYYNTNRIVFRSLRDRIEKIYNNDKIVPFEEKKKRKKKKSKKKGDK